MRLVGTAFVVASAALLVMLAVQNRQPVTVSFDPFGLAAGASVTVPLFVLVFAALITGVILGGMARSLSRRPASRREGPPRRRRKRARNNGPAVAPRPIDGPAPRRHGRFLRR